MNLLVPKFAVRLLPRMLGLAALGGLAAGLYGVLHDEITYSVSPDYFTQMKFIQFHWADYGFPPRVFVAQIGFLASWWVGFASAWFLARIAVPAWGPRLALRNSLIGFGIIFASVILAGCIGAILGARPGVVDADWRSLADGLGINNVAAFVRVGYIHNSSYLGGIVGLIVAIVWLQLRKKAPLPLS